MKKIIIAMITSLLLVSPVYALQQIAGPLVISVPIGGSSSAQYGLVNDENETITISLRAEGDAAKYLSFPATVDLEPGKIVYTDITARIPADYDKSLGNNITGYLYALQEGKPGQVKVNIQMKKSVMISVSGLSNVQTVENPKTVETNQPTAENTANPMTGLFSLASANSIVIIFIVALVIVFIFIKIRRGGEKK